MIRSHSENIKSRARSAGVEKTVSTLSRIKFPPRSLGAFCQISGQRETLPQSTIVNLQTFDLSQPLSTEHNPRSSRFGALQPSIHRARSSFSIVPSFSPAPTTLRQQILHLQALSVKSFSSSFSIHRDHSFTNIDAEVSQIFATRPSKRWCLVFITITKFLKIFDWAGFQTWRIDTLKRFSVWKIKAKPPYSSSCDHPNIKGSTLCQGSPTFPSIYRVYFLFITIDTEVSQAFVARPSKRWRFHSEHRRSLKLLQTN